MSAFVTSIEHDDGTRNRHIFSLLNNADLPVVLVEILPHSGCGETEEASVVLFVILVDNTLLIMCLLGHGMISRSGQNQ